jgi:hypothetical protein
MDATFYSDRFDAELAARIGQGGSVILVAELVAAYDGRDPALRQEFFDDWLSETTFSCSDCGRPFEAEPGGVEEDDAVLCPRCRDT